MMTKCRVQWVIVAIVLNLSMSYSVRGMSSAITDSYCQTDLEVNSKSVLAM